MKKIVTSFLAILATYAVAISAFTEVPHITSEVLLEPDMCVSYSEKVEDNESEEEPECHTNCDLPIDFDGDNDY